MTVVTLIARLALATVFAIAAATKLADREGTRKAVAAFGAPERLAAPLAILLPLAELVVAGLLLPATTAVYGAVGALCLLAIFSIAIAVSLARGRTPDCHCFGQLHSEPASWKTLVRNGVLAAVAVVALAGSIAEPDASAVAWIGDLGGAELLALAVAVCAGVVLVVGGFAFLTLMRSYGNVLVRLDSIETALAASGIDLAELAEMPEFGLEPGSPAPAFSARSLAGDEVTLESLTSAGLPALLFFTSPHCGPCQSLLPTASAWQHEYGDVLQLVFVTDGTADEVRTEAEEFELEHVLLDEDHALYGAFEASGTPSAVLVAPDGAIGSWVAAGSEWVERLVADATAGEPEPEGLPLGAEAPAVELPTLDGEQVSLADLRGRDTLLLFWNPGCGFCRSMHEGLRAWEESTNGVAPRLVVISSGDAESTRAEEFQSLVLMDESWETAGAFQAGGTPMAVLIDADGKIASHVAAGADAVLALANANGGP